MKKYHVLTIEDEYAISRVLKLGLEHQGFDVTNACTLQEGIRVLLTEEVDLILLDVMLPDGDGLTAGRAIIDDYKVPVIFLTARGDQMDRIIGLEIGADDYIVKPVDVREIGARIHAVVRRVGQSKKESRKNRVHLAGDYYLHQTERLVLKRGQRIELTRKEYDLLVLFVNNPGRVFERTDLLDKIWSYTFAGNTRTVDIHVTRLRKKLGELVAANIETVYGVGYRYRPGQGQRAI